MASKAQSEIIEGYRVSAQQERIWRLQSVRRNTVYRVQCAVVIDGALHTETLRFALGDVVKRHEILRTTFHCLPGMAVPVQVVNDAVSGDSISWNVEDYSATELFRREELIEELLHAAREKPYNFESGPLVHALLSKLGPDCHVLVLDLPALCADRASLRNIIDELSRTYAAGGIDTRLHEGNSEPIQYADFSAWQNELFDSDETHAGRNYWLKQSATPWITRDLPFEEQTADLDQNGPQTQFAPLSLEIDLGRELSAKLEDIASQSESSVPTLLQASWQVLLWRLTGQSEIVVGTAHEGRSYSELKAAVGPFAKCLPVICQLDEATPFTTLIKNLEAAIIETTRAQEYFRWDVATNSDKADGSRFFSYCFDYAEPAAPFVSSAITFSLIREHVCLDRFKVLLVCGRRSNSLWAEFHYDSALFDHANIELMSRQYEKLLSSVVHNPNAKLSDLDLVADSERHKLLEEWNSTDASYATQTCLHELFEKQVGRTPGALGVIGAAGQELSYAELNARANQLAHVLIARGVIAESRVALLLERSPEMVISILAVLKAGAGYLPLDPELPTDRLSFMLEDAAPEVLITDTAESAAVATAIQSPLSVIRLDESGELLSQQSTSNPCVAVLPCNVAYAIYTSGSTGRPKAVAVEHQSICNRLLWMQQEFPLAATDRVLQKTSYSFDASIWELLLPLLSGAQVVLAKAGGQRDSGYLVTLMEQAEVTVLQMVPSMLTVLLGEYGLRKCCPRLRRIFCGGEALSAELQQRFHQELGETVELVNLYGPTEASIDASFRRCGVKDVHRGKVMIGRPIANMRLYVLDHVQRLSPVGAAGELYLGGVGVARGYLHRSALTAERFIPNPWARYESERLYRTGDIVRRLGDGELEYLGRADQQVKIRGYRIELGEVETALRRQQGVSEAVVVAPEDVAGERRLVAYVVLHQYQASAAKRFSRELRRKLAETLPDYMVPSTVVMMEKMPHLANGKIDRNALSGPERSGQEQPDDHVVPHTQVEEVIAGIWAKLLRVDEVGAGDNFFDLGGHSLMATQLVSRVRKAFQVELPLRALFDSPTVAGMAKNVQLLMQEELVQEIPNIVPVPRTGELPLSFAQQRLWFLDQFQPDSAFYNLPAVIRLTGHLNLPALQQSFDEIVRRHASLRTTFTSVDGQPTQVIAPALPVTLALDDLQALSESLREAKTLQIATEEVQKPFDLSTGPLFRVRILRIAEQEHILLMTLHHIISDGWSSGVLIREMVALYEAHAEGKSVALPELPIQYADFAHWQRSWLQGEVLQRQLEYWRKRLAGAPAMLELPADRLRPRLQTYRGGRQSLSLSAAMLTDLKALSREEAVTLFMLLLAAFKVLLSRYSGQEDIVVGTPIAGRNHVETESLIGFFVNTLVLRTDLSGNPTFQELLGRIRETSLGASAYQDLPFEKLVEELQPVRDLNRSPLFQVMFALQNGTTDSYELKDLILEPLETDTGTAKFDLELYFQETSDGLVGTFEYNSDLFDKSTIERMAKHYEILLKDIITNPKQRTQRLQMLTAAEERQQLEAKSKGAEYRLERSFDEVFREQVAASPGAIAVVSGAGALSYGELNERANQVAHWLRAAGVGAEAVVGLLADRTAGLLIGMLGLFKVGAAYLPLDPRQPAARQRQLVEQSGLRLVLASAEYSGELRQAVAELPVAQQPEIRELAEAWQAGSGWSKAAVTSASRPEQLAYVIYTSGSTGVPKGAMITQRGLVNHLSAKVAELELGAGDCVAQTASQCFDISVWQFLAVLLVGGRVQLVSDETGIDPPALLRLVAEQGVTVMETVPSLLGALLAELEAAWGEKGVGAEGLAGLRWLLATGEALAPELCRRWAGVGARQTRLLNAYGPTECADDVTHYEVREAPGAAEVRTPIGRALGNTRLYILNEALTLLPRGVVGELYVGGAGVGRGYLRDAERTAQSFGPDPYSKAGGARLYRTGDLVRERGDGELEYVGRRDQQVKVRGYRIELGEIEAVLQGHAGVQEAVVVARRETGGEQRLVGYVMRATESNGESAVGVSELRAYVRERLPEYMVPQALVLLAQIPLTANGKIDRKALPSPDGPSSDEMATYVAPRTELEQQIASVWQEVLRVEKVGLHDNFFDLGGHSILLIEASSKLRLALNRELSVVDMFRHPTVSAMAMFLGAEQSAEIKFEDNLERADLRRVSAKRSLKERKQRRGRSQENFVES